MDVERNQDGFVQVVCGAPNVREGLMVAWLPPGSTVPASVDSDPFVLGARELRGVMSNGMLASASELALSDDHSGILELDEGNPGDDFAETFGLNDYIIDIENKMFTHRPDCFGILGVAREIAGITGQKFTSPEVYLHGKPQVVSQDVSIEVQNQAGDLVPRFMAQVITNVRVGASPVWLQTYLMRCGVRPINNIVDITNYFMLLTGQPLHAYDYDKLLQVSGHESARLEARLSRKGDKLLLLNGKELEFQDDSTILITSNDVPVGIGGVMGGTETEVDESTRRIVLECASFDMYSIRKTSMKYGLFTDAVTRFNKGQSPLQTESVLAWAGNEIANQQAGELGQVQDVQTNVAAHDVVSVQVDFINNRLGLDLSASDVQQLLENVEFSVERPDNQNELRITPPFWRTDIEIAEDVVEEVGRLYGFDHLPIELPKRDVTPAPRNAMLELKLAIRQTLSKSGANEVLTYSFVHGDLLAKVGQNADEAFKLSNALSPDLQYFRMSVLPSLLDRVHMNVKAGYDHYAIFELGKSHMKGPEDADDPGLPKEFNTLAFVVTRTDKIAQKGAAYFDARAYLDQLAQDLGVAITYEKIDEAPTYPAAAPFDHTRSARVYVGEKLIGVVGEFKSSVRKNLKLPLATAGFEIAISPEVLKGKHTSYVPLSRFPSVQQDISLKVPANVSYAEVFSALTDQLIQTEMMTTLKPLDIYKRDDDSGYVQMTFRFTVASYEKTLKAEEVNKMLDAASLVLKDKLGADRL